VAGFAGRGERGGEDRAETEAGDAEGSQLTTAPTPSFLWKFDDGWEDAPAGRATEV
jgi:hypothetical protein